MWTSCCLAAGEAITLQYLASVVISIHHDYITPDTLAEAYVLNFAYKGDGQQPRMGITVSNDTADIPMQNQQDMKKLFTRLLKLANAHKVDLPEHPAIGMQLTYNETCPEGYQLLGFRAAPPSKWIDEKGATVVGAKSGDHKMHMRMIPPLIRPPKAPLKATMQLDFNSSPPQSELRSIPQREPRKVVQRMVAPKQVAPETQFFAGSLDGMQAAQRKALPKGLGAHGHPVEQNAGGRIFRFRGAKDSNKLPLQLQPMLSQSASMVAVLKAVPAVFVGRNQAMLHYLVKEAKSASLRLAEEGYLKEVYRTNENKAKSFRKGPLLPPFEFDKTQEPRLLKEYWNPAYKIDAYVDTQREDGEEERTEQPLRLVI